MKVVISRRACTAADAIETGVTVLQPKQANIQPPATKPLAGEISTASLEVKPQDGGPKDRQASIISSWTQPSSNGNIWDVSDKGSVTEDTEYVDSEETRSAETSTDVDPELEDMVRLFIRMMSEFSQNPRLPVAQAASRPNVAKKMANKSRSRRVQSEHIIQNEDATSLNAGTTINRPRSTYSAYVESCSCSDHDAVMKKSVVEELRDV